VYENELRFNIVKAGGEIAEAGLKPSGWKPFVKPEGDALKGFDEALKGFVGVGVTNPSLSAAR
jgi:hypothetical protein